MNTQNFGGSRGFTLVEMSIVLVIIGLIIGGILKGQEVIASARQKAVINQVNAVRSATNTYFDRYRALPGDDSTASTTLDGNLADGDGNGVVGATSATAADLVNDTGVANENYTFFNGLIAAGLLNGGQVTSTISTAGFGISALPAAPITGAGMEIVYGTHEGNSSPAATKTAHFLRLHKGVTTPAAAVSPRTVQNMDTQIDDGVAFNGGVRGDGNVTGGCNTAATATYAISDNTTCIPVFEISQ